MTMTHLTHFQEITILPDPEITTYFIWRKLYTQLHIALADVKNTHGIDSIGVAFPNYRYEKKERIDKDGKIVFEEFGTLGNRLRVFAPSEAELVKLDLNKWLDRLTDYVHIKPIKTVPDEISGYVSVHRYRHKSAQVQASSLAKKLGISLKDAMATVAKRQPEMKLPFIKMHSETNNSDYHLHILQKSSDEAKAGSFNVYGMNGMSDYVSVPNW